MVSAPPPKKKPYWISNVLDDHVDFASLFQACIYAVRNTWSWLSQASRCMEIHLQNASQYHQVSRHRRMRMRMDSFLSSFGVFLRLASVVCPFVLTLISDL